ncbi:NUDIX domain-containing protein [uncultured Roseibium sp.]|uniref:NUDIX domain-containing protein n=1 Tax=uncultured Roseibium sp. TaxID=1936171 RepID=UPI002622CCA7|nr:NUDIX domain-containing protein [uncultured Roseibium sp.]
MELLILCAGAADRSWTGPVLERPLRSKGKRRAQKVGAWMGRHSLEPERVLSASGKRSLVTAEKALKAGGWTAQDIDTSDPLTDGTLPILPKAKRVLLVAPSKTVQSLASQLGVQIETRSGALFVLSFENGKASLKHRIDPRELPDLFPFPSPNGHELRPRPAYYYTQSAVIPFRRTARDTEILIVRSSSGRHWVVPKGIVEPGLGPARSALIEAREEAGVEGLVLEKPLGSYAYEKWGATCNVEVYAMEVSRVLAHNEWEESHRERQWTDAAEAANLIHQPELKHLIALL